MKLPSSPSIGLVGDGDEIAAIAEVEADFGVALDVSDAIHWITAGDVYRSLNKALLVRDFMDQTNWNRFAAAICRETGIDPATIDRDTPLLGEPRLWSGLTRASAALLAVIAISLLLAVALSII